LRGQAGKPQQADGKRVRQHCTDTPIAARLIHWLVRPGRAR
jgi:hypothetical protein